MRKRGLLHCGYRALVHITSFFLPVFLATHGQTTHRHLFFLICCSSFVSCSPHCSLFYFPNTLTDILCHQLSKREQSLAKPPFSIYLFSTLDLFFHGVEWFLGPVFFPALLKHKVTSLWRAVSGNQSLKKSPYCTEAEPALCPVNHKRVILMQILLESFRWKAETVSGLIE